MTAPEQISLIDYYHNKLGGYKPSQYQADIYQWIENGRGNGTVNAVAGSGKTHTIVNACKLLSGSAVFIAFSKKIVETLVDKLSGTTASAKTVHSIGYGIVANHIRPARIKIEDHKYRDLCRAWCDQNRALDNATKTILEQDDTFPDWSKSLEDLVHFCRCTLTDPYSDPRLGVMNDALYEMVAKFGIETYGYLELLVAGIATVIRQGADMAILDGKIDYTDMIYLPYYWYLPALQTFQWVLIDEQQDLSACQLDLVLKLQAAGGRMLFVGDPCQPESTLVSTPNGPVKIQDLKVGDRVISYTPRDCAFIQGGRTVNGITARPYSGVMIDVSTDKHNTRYTPNHHCLANFSLLRNRYAVYLMQKGDQFRVGLARLDYGTGGNGPYSRMRAEQADSVWVLDTYEDRIDAFVMESAISGKFGLPQLRFKDNFGSNVFTNDRLDAAWQWIGSNTGRALECLAYFGRDVRYPLFSSDTKAWTGSMKRPMIVRACNLMTGAKMLPYAGNSHVKAAEWLTITVSRSHYDGCVYSLDVDTDHLYVGDGLVTHNCQSIMGFAGADCDSFWKIKEATQATELPLSVNYRCPKSHIKAVVDVGTVPHIKAHDGAIEGVIRTITPDVLVKEVKEGDMILCRMNAPLIGTAIDLIAARIPARVLGRDIGKELGSLAEKIIKRSDGTFAKFIDAVDAYEKKEQTRLMKKKNYESALQSLSDKCECLRVIYTSSKAENLTELKADIDALFSEGRASVTLCTVHKSKGLENPRIFIINPESLPLRWPNQQKWQYEQELNLQYVAMTRAQEEIIYVREKPATAGEKLAQIAGAV